FAAVELDGDARPALADPVAEHLALLMAEDAADAALRDFYASRDFAPAWVDTTGLTANGEALIAALSDAAADGLHPDVYLNRPILSRIEATDPSARAEPEVLPSQDFAR